MKVLSFFLAVFFTFSVFSFEDIFTKRDYCGINIQMNESYMLQGFHYKLSPYFNNGIEVTKTDGASFFVETVARPSDSLIIDDKLFILTWRELEVFDLETRAKVGSFQTILGFTPDQLPRRGHPHGMVQVGRNLMIAHGILGISRFNLDFMKPEQDKYVETAVTDIDFHNGEIMVVMDNNWEEGFRGLGVVNPETLTLSEKVFLGSAYAEHLHVDERGVFVGYFTSIWKFDRSKLFSSRYNRRRTPRATQIFHRFQNAHEIEGRPYLNDDKVFICVENFDIPRSKIPQVYKRDEVNL